jgi:hypothetical protein
MSRPRAKAETSAETLAKLADPEQQFLLFIDGIECLNMIEPADPKVIAAGPISGHLQLYYEMCQRVRAKLLDIQAALLARGARERLGKPGRKAS